MINQESILVTYQMVKGYSTFSGTAGGEVSSVYFSKEVKVTMNLSVVKHTYSHYLHQIVSNVFIEFMCNPYSLSVLRRESGMYILVMVGLQQSKTLAQ